MNVCMSCMYHCMYACMHVCMYLCICMYVCMYVHVYLSVYVRTCTYTCMYVCTFTYTSLCISLCISVSFLSDAFFSRHFFPSSPSSSSSVPIGKPNSQLNFTGSEDRHGRLSRFQWRLCSAAAAARD